MDELKEAFHRDVIRFGHVPTRTEQNKHGTYTGTTYRNRFGSWNNALEELGYPIRKHHGLIEVDCFHCGKTVEKEHWELEKYNKTFCSQDCLYKARVTEECDFCGGEYSQSYLNAGKQNGYCSDECAEKSRLALFKCDHCGDLFKRNKYQTLGDSIYCSEECGYEGNATSREDCIQALERGLEIVGKEAPLTAIIAAGGMAGGQYRRHFDGLNELARAAGYPKLCGHWFIECENCGEEFKRIKSHASNNKHQFCNQECYFEWARSGALRGGEGSYNNDYGPNWYYQRRAARARDDYKCRSCGMSDEEHKQIFGSRLEVHHIKKARLFDDYKERNDLSNLLTVCKYCHITWEHMSIRPQTAD